MVPGLLAVMVAFGALDAAHLARTGVTENRPARLLKFGSLAVLAGAVARGDDGWLTAAFAAALVGDVFFGFLHRFTVGVGCFAVVQLLLVARHAPGAVASASALAAAVGLAVVAVAAFAAMAPGLGDRRPVVAAYIALSWLSVAVAAARALAGAPGGVAAAVGLGLLATCDVLIGLRLAWPRARQPLAAVNWWFYLPAMMALAASGGAL